MLLVGRNWQGLPQEVAIVQSRLFGRLLFLRLRGLAAAVNVVCSINSDFVVILDTRTLYESQNIYHPPLRVKISTLKLSLAAGIA
jgi:hypothetical protein